MVTSVAKPMHPFESMPSPSHRCIDQGTTSRLVQNLRGRSRRARLVGYALWFPLLTFPFLASTLTALAADESDAEAPRIPTYRERYTAESKNPPFAYDIHAWVYPASSAARFQMPEEWSDEALEGTLALAYRVEWLSGHACGYEDSPHCRARVRCVVDAYWDQPSGLPFRNDLEVNHDSFGGEDSMHWLTPQSESEHEAISALRRGTTLSGAVLLSYRDREGRDHVREINTFQYERRMYELDQLSFQIPCDVPSSVSRRQGPVEIVIGSPGTTATDLREAATFDDESRGGALESAPGVHHVIRIPGTFHRRWQLHHEEFLAWEPAYHDTYAEGPWWPSEAYVESDYAHRFGGSAEGAYDEDIHIWTYTREFADRFGMPEEWIAQESLGDALALGYRVERDVAGVCGAAYDLSNCRRFERCMWDVYLPSDAPVPWYVDWPVSNLGGGRENSIRFLQDGDPAHNRQTQEVHYLAKFIHGGHQQGYEHVAARIAWQSEERRRMSLLGIRYWSDWFWTGGTHLIMRSHERRIDGLQVLSIQGDCAPASIWENRRDEENVQSRDYRLLLLPRMDKTVDFFSRMSEGRFGKPEALVEIGIPYEFKVRWLDYQTQEFRFGRRLERMLGVGGASDD